MQGPGQGQEDESGATGRGLESCSPLWANLPTPQDATSIFSALTANAFLCSQRMAHVGTQHMLAILEEG